MNETTTPARNLRIGDHIDGEGFVSSVQQSVRMPGKLIIAVMSNGASSALVADPTDTFNVLPPVRLIHWEGQS